MPPKRKSANDRVWADWPYGLCVPESYSFELNLLLGKLRNTPYLRLIGSFSFYKIRY